MYNTEKSHNNEELAYNNNRFDYYIDAIGYLHFITEYAGDIIISDGPLERKFQFSNTYKNGAGQMIKSLVPFLSQLHL